MWAYIREAELQDPKDRRKIRNDDKMFRVFKCKTMNMMHIAKKLSPHLKKYSELVVGDDETAGSSSSAATKGGGGGRPTKGSRLVGLQPLCNTAVRLSRHAWLLAARHERMKMTPAGLVVQS